MITYDVSRRIGVLPDGETLALNPDHPDEVREARRAAMRAGRRPIDQPVTTTVHIDQHRSALVTWHVPVEAGPPLIEEEI